MARSRNIKPGFFTNDELAECDPHARLLFAGLWTIADKEGRLDDRPKKVKAMVLPFDNVDCDKLLQQLHDRKFIHRYQVKGDGFIQIANWKKHQNPHCKEAPSEIPEPCQEDESKEEAPGKTDERTGQEQCNEDTESPQVTDNSEAPVKHDACSVQEQEQHATNPADSFNLIPDSLTLIPDSVVNTQAAEATCPEEDNVHQMASRYAFEGKVVRLNQKDFDSWKALFSNIDLVSELTRLDLEFTHEKPKNWFSTASAKLNYQNKNAARQPGKRAVNESFATKDYGQTEIPDWARD